MRVRRRVSLHTPLLVAMSVLVACGDDAADSEIADVADAIDAAVDIEPGDSAGGDDVANDLVSDGSGEADIEPLDARQADVADAADTTEPDAVGPEPVDYADLANWLCHPDNPADPCDADHSYTEIDSDGSGVLIEHTPAADPPVDCFYVYPTASADARPNSDLRPGVEEAFVARTQVGPLNQVCRVFGPTYRQVTLTGLLGIAPGEPDRELAYGDVVDAWEYYLANENGGRGVIFVGHSQGTGVLRRLIAERVETDDDVRSRLIAAYLFGGTIEIPQGADVGGSFARTPACRTRDQVGCVISFATFAESSPPPSETFFGRASAGNVALCNPPGGLDGERAMLDGRYPTEVPGLFGIAAGDEVSPYAEPDAFAPLTTDNFGLADHVFGTCKVVDGISYLEVSLSEGSGDVRITEFSSGLGPSWGLHLLDVFFVMNDLVSMAELQIDAWLAR